MPKKTRPITTEDALRMLKKVGSGSGGGSGAVTSVNGKKGAVVLTAEDVGALPNTTAIPTKTSELENDEGFLTPKDIGNISSVQSDWMQNDFNAPSYIQNKTHWAVVSRGEMIIFAEVNFEDGMCGINAHPNFTIGDTYMVTIGSFAEVSCVAAEYIEDGVALGVQLTMMSDDEMVVIVEFYDDFADMMGVPVMVVSTYNGHYSINVFSTQETVHKLPSKYLNMSDIVQAVIVALKGESDAVFGVVDDANNITISGSLESGTYTLKYENADGTTTEIGTFTVGEVGPAYTNVFDPAKATLNQRWSNSSYAFVTSSGDGYVVSDYIPVSLSSDTSNPTMLHFRGGTFAGNANIVFYDSSKSIKPSATQSTNGAGMQVTTTEVTTDENGDYQIKLGYKNKAFDSNWTSGVAYMRVGLQINTSGTAITATDIQDVIMTINELIED